MNRELGAAVALCLTGAGTSLLAASRVWVRYEEESGLSSLRLSSTGAQVAGGLRPLAYLGLAGVVALLAARSWGRRVIGLVLAGAGAGIVAVSLDHGSLPYRNPVTTGWPWVGVVGGVLLLGSGLLTAVRGHRWAGMSTAYRTPAARAAEPAVTEKGIWDALDRGEDPTASRQGDADTVNP